MWYDGFYIGANFSQCGAIDSTLVRILADVVRLIPCWCELQVMWCICIGHVTCFKTFYIMLSIKITQHNRAKSTI